MVESPPCTLCHVDKIDSVESDKLHKSLRLIILLHKHEFLRSNADRYFVGQYRNCLQNRGKNYLWATLTGFEPDVALVSLKYFTLGYIFKTVLSTSVCDRLDSDFFQNQLWVTRQN